MTFLLEREGDMKLPALLQVIFLWAFTAQVTGEVIWQVPGYGTLNGTMENSTYSDRTFYAFRSVFYADMPTPELRFLVSIATCSFYVLLNVLFFIASIAKNALR